MRILIMLIALAAATGPAYALSFQIGDNDGYGVGVLDNAPHPFDGVCDPACANVDNRSLAEMAALDGAQYTDTYSTTHPGYAPQPGTVATFIFSGLNANPNWTVGHLEIDMADFQALTFGAVITHFNGILEPFNYNDGYPNTFIRFYNLQQSVLDSINLLGSLTITIDRNLSNDFYGFDYLKLNDVAAPPIPEPETYALMLAGLGLVGFMARRRKQKAA